MIVLDRIRRLEGRALTILKASAGAVGAKLVTTFTALVTVPVTLGHLGKERYGLWLAISGVMAMMSFADFGLGSGLVNSIVAARGAGDEQAVRRSVSNTFFMLLFVSALLIAATLVLVPFLPWASLLKFRSDTARAEVVPALLILGVGALVDVPLSIVSRIQVAYEEAARSAAWAVANTLTQLAAVLLAVRFTHGLPALVACYMTASVATVGSAFAYEVLVRRPELRPDLRLYDRDFVFGLVRRGGLFFTYQMAVNVTIWTDYMIVGNILGVQANARYGVAFRLFSVGMLAAYASRGVWPVFASAVATGDFAWARRSFRKLLRLAGVCGLAAGVLIALCAPFLAHHWVGKDIDFEPSLLGAFVAWLVVFNLVEAITPVAMGDAFVRPHVLAYVVASVAAIAFRVLLVERIGLSGVVWGASLAFALMYVVPMAAHVYRRLGRTAPDAA